MKRFVLILTGIGLALFFSTGTVLAADDAMQTLARITATLNHFPSDDDKAALQAIIDSDDSTEEEADIAMVIANIEHKVQEDDTERLTDIINDDASDAKARKLAEILLRINHAASDADKAELAAMAAD